jgi:hypothetical protein
VQTIGAMGINSIFTEHPATVGQTYWQHCGSSLSFGYSLLRASLAAGVHALFPCAFEKTASGIVSELYQRMVVNRNARGYDAK